MYIYSLKQSLILVSGIFIIIFCFLKGALKAVRLSFLYKHISVNNIKKRSTYPVGKIYAGERISKIFKQKKEFLIPLIFFIILTIFYLFFKNISISIFFSMVCTIILFEVMQGIEKKRKEFFEVQVAEFISNMIILLKSGKSIRQIFNISLSWFKNPLHSYLKKFDNEIQFGVPLEEALENFSKKADNLEITLLTNAMKINNKIGGNFLFIASNILDSVQENIKIRTKIKTRTAQSRLSGNIIVFFPAAGLTIMYFIFNSAVEKFITTGLGVGAILTGTVLELAGYLIVKRIVREDYL